MGERRTLWELSETNRARRARVLAWFLTLWLLAVGVPIAAGSLTVGFLLAGNLSASWTVVVFVFAVAVAVVLGCLYVEWASRHAETRLLARLDASPVERDRHPATRDALYAIALAMGLPRPPRLYLIPMRHSVNAVVVGLTPETSAIAVTWGLAERAPLDTQEAVLASLLCRFREGGVSWTTLIAVLTGPLGRTRERVAAIWRGFEANSGPKQVAIMLGTLVFFPLTIAFLWFSFVTGLFLRSYAASFKTLARSADVEGLALVRDPEQMIAALKAVYAADHHLPYAEEMDWIAYARGSELNGSWGEERLQRLEQLAQHIGEPIVEDIEPDSFAPAPPEVPNPVTARLNEPGVVARREYLRTTREELEHARKVRERQKHLPPSLRDWFG